jgi:glycosyltransferase involved in cell wall biosynthesis
MNLTYLSASEVPSQNANSIQVMKMCQAFAKNGHKVTLYSRKSNQCLSNSIYDFYDVKPSFKIQSEWWPAWRGLGGFLYSIQVKQSIFSLGLPDLFYGRDIYSLLAVASTSVPLIYEAHTPPQNGLRKYLENKLIQYSNFKRIVVISNALRQEYLNLFLTLNPQKVLVAHDGADLPINKKEDLNTAIWRGRQNQLQVGYVGSLYPGKGMELIAVLGKKLPNIDFHVVGGTEQDLRYWSHLVDMKNVYFHKFVPQNQLSGYYDNFDVVLAPYQHKVRLKKGKGEISRWMSPLKIFEYMALEKPIICSDLPVLKEVLSDGFNALLVPPDDVQAWVKAILYLQENPRVRKRIASNAFNDFQKNYTWDKRAELVIQSPNTSQV